MMEYLGTNCVCGHCCVECDCQESQDGTCFCGIAEDLDFNREDILKYCQFAEEN